MKNPGFYCKNFIEHHNSLPRYQPPGCTEQCDACMDDIIDHHFSKTARNYEIKSEDAHPDNQYEWAKNAEYYANDL